MNGSDTPERLVSAAERLFADGGEESTSLRAIAREARSNAAAVHYHFGGRDDLLCAVLRRHFDPVHSERLRLVDRLPQPASVSAVVEAVVRPSLELLGSLGRKRYQVAHFLGRAHTLPGAAVSAYRDRQWADLSARVVPRLAEALPEVPPDELAARLRLVLATAMARFVDAAHASVDVEAEVARLVTFSAAGLAAAPPATPAPSVARARAASPKKHKKPRR